MINIASRRVAEVLSDYVGRPKDVDYIRYGIEIMFRGFIKLFVLFFTAYAFGLLLPMILVWSTFVVFRFLTGGHHYSTYFRCLIVGTISLVSISYFVTKFEYVFGRSELLVLLTFSLIIGLYFSFNYAPSNHFYKKMTKYQKGRLKKVSIITVSIWGNLMFLLIFSSISTVLILASILGFLFQMMSIHPYSYLFVNNVEKLLERR
ncbi:hypothetical protein BKP35_13075 [Anaerobacillus arseniciselenatis]|uniref:AgrB-like protein n=1 Tax=Anaerobacillus arseniciselenatis TaxID=85682 RepID=A0A1S2LEW4_9BACI|nr:accessory gene regulator B family protein [Anaerobacillus arseniciselenatis]OIJ10864.1 hypothetical protein BKP35_13075 [Anaerobacillus arseniciselenatis]